MFNEAVQPPVIYLDEFPDLQVEDLPQFGNLHNVHMFGFDKVFEMERGESPFPWKGKKI